MTINDLPAIGAQAAIITGSNVSFESAVEEFNINDGGSLQLSWVSATGGGFKVGYPIGNYILDTPYVPSYNGDGTYRYDLRLKNKNYVKLSKKLFIRTYTYEEDGEPKTRSLFTFPYTGYAGTLVAEMDGVTLEDSLSDMLISVAFDGDYIKGAAQKVADALGATLWFDGTGFHIGVPETYLSSEYYDKFYVFGGTKNMAKQVTTLQGTEYAAVTQRLMLAKAGGDAKGSFIGNEDGIFEKVMIFDDIFPRVLMRITNVRERECYLLDEDGDYITDGNDNKLTYKKYYITLTSADGVNIDQSKLEKLIIDGTVLRLRFVPYTDPLDGVQDKTSAFSPLAGREFELVHFKESTPEWESDDVLDQQHKFVAQAGEYRIVINADGSTLLPNDTIKPVEGNLVYLVNIALPDGCMEEAQARLLARATEASHYYSNATTPQTSTQTAHGSAVIIMDDQLNGSTDAGQTADGFITSKRTDLLTGEVQITRGNFEPKGLLSTMIDKVESAHTTGNGGATGEKEEGEREVATMSQEQWDALAKAGGHRGVVALNKRIKDSEDSVAGLAVDVRNIEQQTDQSILIWYGIVDPTTSNYPASEWQTEGDKELHLGDMFYNENREPASTGGRAWKWSKETVEGVTVYGWESITDLDTLASLEKIADVAGDGIITGGAEKQRLYLAWKNYCAEYGKLSSLANTYGLSWSAMNGAMEDYLGMINGMSAPSSAGFWDGTVAPEWLEDLSESTVLADYELTPEGYRSKVNALDASMTALQQLVDQKAKEALDSISDMASDSKLDPTEKLSIKREFKGMVEDMQRTCQRCTAMSLTTEGNAYRSSLCAIGTFLNGGIPWSDTGVFTYPSWLDTYKNRTENITASTWNDLWTAFYNARSAAENALVKKAQDDASAAMQPAQGAKVTVSDTRPSVPYTIGDMWLDTSSNELWICKTTRLAGDTSADFETDWQKPESSGTYLSSITDKFADFVTIFCPLVESFYGVRAGGTTPESFKVYISATQPTGYSETDIWYEGTTGGVYGTIHWQGRTSYYNTDENVSLQNLLPSLAAIEAMGFASFKVYTTMPSAGNPPSNYDVRYQRLSFHDSFTKEDVYGGIDVYVYNAYRSKWEKVQDGVSGLMENYGDHLIMACFRTDDDGVTNYASRMLTAANFAEMASEAASQDGDKALAAIRTIIEEVNGQLTGKVKIHADQLDLDNGNGTSGVLTMTTGTRPTTLGEDSITGIAFKDSESSEKNIRLQALAHRGHSDGEQYYEHPEEGDVGEIISAWGSVNASYLHLRAVSPNNPGAPAGANPATKAVATISPYGIRCQRFYVREYVEGSNGWVKHLYRGAGTHNNPLSITIGDKTYKVIGGLIVESAEVS